MTKARNMMKTMNLTVNNGNGAMYSQEAIDNAEADLVAQATGENAEGLMQRYPKAVARNFDGDGQVTEMDAVIVDWWAPPSGASVMPDGVPATMNRAPE